MALLTPLMSPDLLREVAAQYGSPTYLYDASLIAARINSLKGFDAIRYAQKACSNLSILSLMRTQGCVVDAVTAGEIYRALLVGYRGARPGSHLSEIVYTADILDPDAIELIRDHNIGINIGSPDMVEQIAAAELKVPVVARVNPGFGHGHSRKVSTGGPYSKHGIWHEQLPGVVQRAAELRVGLIGIHMHIGSGTDFHHLAKVADAILSATRQLGTKTRIVSAGGGLPIPYRPEDMPIDVTRYTELWIATKAKIEQELGLPIHLEVEPGRYLVAESGVLITTVRSVKESGGVLYYLVDAGFDTLVRPAMYGAYHPISVIPKVAPQKDGSNPEATNTMRVVVAGPLCESGDVFTQGDGGVVEERELPEAKVGDLLILHHAGAYGFAMSSNYNSRRRAAEVLVEQCSTGTSRTRLIRERESLEDLVRGERELDLVRG